MKRLLLVLATVALGLKGASAQGYVMFANNSSEPITIFGGSTLIGTNAVATAAGAGPGQVIISLYVQTNGVPVTFNSFGIPLNMDLVGTTANSFSSLPFTQGTFNGGYPLVLPAPYDGSFDIQYYLYAITQNGLHYGHSTLGTGYRLATGTNTVAPLFGPYTGQVRGFNIGVPEPSILALGGLGAAALLLIRRRKG